MPARLPLECSRDLRPSGRCFVGVIGRSTTSSPPLYPPDVPEERPRSLDHAGQVLAVGGAYLELAERNGRDVRERARLEGIGRRITLSRSLGDKPVLRRLLDHIVGIPAVKTGGTLATYRPSTRRCVAGSRGRMEMEYGPAAFLHRLLAHAPMLHRAI